ncbi:DUF1799 domain-containing protein [Paraburkholderia lacunae]|uniref:DUF1799 domain-containing protein n=1 Tax=Paraburkholderia lacunae TaxID=2211104 RepID=UPI001401D852|nr:DUF1799 domain-containing protein [Paraburkholderia lacunae]
MARYWAGERPDDFAADDTVVAGLEAAGAPPEVIERARAQAVREDCYVWADNWPVFEVFAALSGQWRYLPGGTGPPVALGFDYVAVDVTLRLMDVPRKKRSEMFRLLRVMEAEVLDVFREREASA